jgi:hypothetical protein
VALAAVVSLVAPAAFEPSPLREPEALVVTLVMPEPGPPAAAPVEPAAAAAEPETEASGPPGRFDVVTDLPTTSLAPPDELEVLASPDSATTAPPLPESVRAARARLHDCGTASAGEGREDACPPRYRLAQAGPDGEAYLDQTALRPTGFAAGWERVAGTVSSMVVDEHIFDGRGGQPMVGTSEWSMYARANPLAGDWRIFDPETGEVGIAQQAAAP